MRPRRQSGACVRPLNFTVRAHVTSVPSLRPHRFHLALEWFGCEVPSQRGSQLVSLYAPALLLPQLRRRDSFRHSPVGVFCLGSHGWTFCPSRDGPLLSAFVGSCGPV